MTNEERARQIVNEIPADCDRDYDAVTTKLVADAIRQAVADRENEIAAGLEADAELLGQISARQLRDRAAAIRAR